MDELLQCKDEIWHGHDETRGLCLSMTNATFRTYVMVYATYLYGKEPINPTAKDLQEAEQRCKHLSFWFYCQYDKQIQVKRLPTCALSVSHEQCFIKGHIESREKHYARGIHH